MNKALEPITDMIKRSELAQAKFQEGTSQFTLQTNRINALKIAYALLNKDNISCYEKEALEKAVAPIKSLISKSEKAKIKLKQDSWQYKMLESNIVALYVALPLLLDALKNEYIIS
jgi:ferredoxin-fold anticodon binding domain-containing protein